MPDIIVNGRGEVERVPVEDIGELWAEFKQARAKPSRLSYRRDKTDGSTASAWDVFHNFIAKFSRAADKMPKYGTREYDAYIAKIWRDEPILSGVVYGMVAKAQSKAWKLEGGRNNTTAASRLLAEAQYSFYKRGWWGFTGASALDFYTTRIGFVWGVQRRGEYGKVMGLEHIDALSCILTGSYTHPIRYISNENGQEIRFKASQVIQENSLMITREEEMGYGFCAVERALIAAKLLIGLHNYDIEKLSNLPPEGIATIKGMTLEEFKDCLEEWLSTRKQNNALTFPQVLWLLNINEPSEGIEVDLTPFSTLPEQFNREVVVRQYVNILANAFGVSASDIWFMGGGSFGVGKETEVQTLLARGKGEGEWFSLSEQTINRQLPDDVQFSYEVGSTELDLEAAGTAKAWMEVYMPLVEQSQEFGIDTKQWLTLFAQKGIIPTWMADSSQPEVQTIIGSEQTQRMKMSEARDLIAFMWELGKLKEVPVIVLGQPLEVPPDLPPIRGKPIPLREVENGARVSRKAIAAEMKIWRDIPELAGLVPEE